MSSVRLGLCFAAFNFIQSCLADTPKSSKPSSTPKGCTMITWANLGVVDYLRSGALVIAFLAVLVSDKRGRGNARGVARGNNMWVNAEVVSFFVCGLACFFFPTQFLEYITKTSLNAMHIYTIQAIGCALIGVAVTTGRSQSSLENDAAVYTSWLTSRLAGSGAILCFLMRAHSQMDVFTDQNVSFVLLAVFLWFVGCVWQFFTTDKIGGIGGIRGTNSGINFYLMLELCLNFVAAVDYLGHPQAPFDYLFDSFKADALNLHLLQVIAVFVLFMGSLPLLGAFFYANDEDKRQIFFGRLVTFGLLLPCLGLHVWKNFALTRGGYMFMCIGIPLQLAILLRGYFITDGKVKTR